MKKTRNQRPALTDRQQEIFRIIRKYVNRRGYGPSMRELSAETGIRSPNGIMVHLVALGKKGYIYRNTDRSRLLQITPQPQESRTISVSLKEGCLESRFPEGVLNRLKMMGVRIKVCSVIYVTDESFPPFHSGDMILVRAYRRRPKQTPFFYWQQPTTENPKVTSPVRVNQDENAPKFPSGTRYAVYLGKLKFSSEDEIM